MRRVEDTPAGVEAARAAEMRVIAIASTHPRDAVGRADMILDRLLDLVVRINPDGSNSRMAIETRRDP